MVLQRIVDTKVSKSSLEKLSGLSLSPLDLLPHSDLREKLIDLVLNGEPKNIHHDAAAQFHALRKQLLEANVNDVNVVVFGGGSGLSNIIGGDSRLDGWSRDPFSGLKKIFPRTRSIVCVTDDGGSTGELLKDIPLIALGDIRHVLLSSIQLRVLQKKYGLSLQEAKNVADGLANIFNYRLKEGECTLEKIVDYCGNQITYFPYKLQDIIFQLINSLFKDERLIPATKRSHCLGNLILAAAIYQEIDLEYTNIKLEENPEITQGAIQLGIKKLCDVLGCIERAVTPCTTTPSQLRICYTNGVQVTGESKSSEVLRGYPVDRVFVDFSDSVLVPKQIFEDIKNAHIIILAPGSLYSSIIPVFQVPGIAEAVRKNKHALKILISNLWVQAGETDIALSNPDRKFHVSDMIRAYETNIPGGIKDLFKEVLCLSLKDVPGSILQNYAVEGKIPIYLDKPLVQQQKFYPIESGIYSKKALAERGFIQHDPEILAQAVKTIYVTSLLKEDNKTKDKGDVKPENIPTVKPLKTIYPSKKFRLLRERIEQLQFKVHHNEKRFSREVIIEKILNTIWKHQDIPLEHLNYLKGIVFVDPKEWIREQKWDRVFSFYDPESMMIAIRADQVADPRKLEIALLIALGQSLLGNYASEKRMKNIEDDGRILGKVYHLKIKDESELKCFFKLEDIQTFLELARLVQSEENQSHYTRLVNGKEGFTPPGVLMGLTYGWYLDNTLASHIEYKMALMKIRESDLIPEQLKMLSRRESLINFYREKVFCF